MPLKDGKGPGQVLNERKKEKNISVWRNHPANPNKHYSKDKDVNALKGYPNHHDGWSKVDATGLIDNMAVGVSLDYTDTYKLGAKKKLNDVKSNPLHRYASYTCKWTLSGLTEGQIKNPYSFDPPHDIIARTGGIGTTTGFADEIGEVDKTWSPGVNAPEEQRKRVAEKIAQSANKVLRKNQDIYFEKVVMLAVPTPNPDRKLMNFTKIEFELSEPLGISLYEKLRAAAYNGGYLDHLDAPFLLTLEYGGFNSKGEPLPPLPRRYFPIKIIDSEVDVNQGGSRYTMTAVPFTEFGLVNRFLYLRGPLKVTGNTISEQFETIIKGIDELQQKEKEIER